MQPQGHVQVLLNMLRGFTAQAALDAPRFCISAGSPDSEVKNSAEKAGDINSEVYFEEGISDETVAKLRSKPTSLDCAASQFTERGFHSFKKLVTMLGSSRGSRGV